MTVWGDMPFRPIICGSNATSGVTWFVSSLPVHMPCAKLSAWCWGGRGNGGRRRCSLKSAGFGIIWPAPPRLPRAQSPFEVTVPGCCSRSFPLSAVHQGSDPCLKKTKETSKLQPYSCWTAGASHGCPRGPSSWSKSSLWPRWGL